MKANKVSLIDVFSGAPWEVELVKGLLQAANVKTLVREEGEFRVSVPSESYATAVRIISDRF